jgi:hypothetical protein
MAFGLPQDGTPQSRAKIAMSMHCLSITDNYWINFSEYQRQWKDINIQTQSLSNALAIYALTEQGPA